MVGVSVTLAANMCVFRPSRRGQSCSWDWFPVETWAAGSSIRSLSQERHVLHASHGIREVGDFSADSLPVGTASKLTVHYNDCGVSIKLDNGRPSPEALCRRYSCLFSQHDVHQRWNIQVSHNIQGSHKLVSLQFSMAWLWNKCIMTENSKSNEFKYNSNSSWALIQYKDVIMPIYWGNQIVDIRRS